MKPQLPSNSCQSQKEGDSSGHSPFCLGAFVTDVASCCQSIETKKREILSLYTFTKALAIGNKRRASESTNHVFKKQNSMKDITHQLISVLKS